MEIHVCLPPSSSSFLDTFSRIDKQILDDIRVGNDDLDVLQLLFGDEALLLALAADTHQGLFLEIQGEDHDDHAPDGAVAVGGEAARLAVGAQAAELLPGDPDAQLLPDLALHGLKRGFIIFNTTAHQAPHIGGPALLQQQPSLAGDDGVGAQMGTHGGLGGIGVAPIKCDDGLRVSSCVFLDMISHPGKNVQKFFPARPYFRHRKTLTLFVFWCTMHLSFVPEGYHHDHVLQTLTEFI